MKLKNWKTNLQNSGGLFCFIGLTSICISPFIAGICWLFSFQSLNVISFLLIAGIIAFIFGTILFFIQWFIEMIIEILRD